MAPEMFIGLGLSGLLIMMFGKSPSPNPPKNNKKTVVTLVLPDGEGLTVKELKGASLEKL